jgi:polyisoprenoid-binding protein YceI
MKSLVRSLLSLSVVTASLSFAALTQDGMGSATFDAKGTAGIKIHGVVDKKVVVADDGTTFKVTVKTADIDTDNSLRNKHMGEDIGAATFPTMELSVPTAKLKLPEDGKSVDEKVKGTLTWHEHTKEIDISYKATTSGKVTTVTANAAISTDDFGIKIRSYLGIGVKPDVEIGATFAVKK